MSLWAKIKKKKKTQGLAEAAHGTGATLSWELRRAVCGDLSRINETVVLDYLYLHRERKMPVYL